MASIAKTTKNVKSSSSGWARNLRTRGDSQAAAGKVAVKDIVAVATSIRMLVRIYRLASSTLLRVFCPLFCPRYFGIYLAFTKGDATLKARSGYVVCIA